MVRQASEVNGNDHSSPVQGVARGAASVMSDALDLAQLQAQLLRADLKDAERSIQSSFVTSVIAIGLVISGLPVLAFGLAHTLAWLVKWPPWICELVTGAVFVGTAIVLLQMSLKWVGEGLKTFKNSYHEFLANVQWLRSTVRQDFKDNNHYTPQNNNKGS